MQDTDHLKKTEALADEELRLLEQSKKEHADLISRLVLGVEAVLIKEGATWGDWHELIGLFNQRAEQVVPLIKIAALKQRFDKITNA